MDGAAAGGVRIGHGEGGVSMERLTRKKRHKICDAGRHPTEYTSRHTFQEVVARLAAYEDTGLGPEEIVGADNMLKENWDIPLSRLKEAIELIKAKDEKRLKVLPPNGPLTLEELREMGASLTGTSDCKRTARRRTGTFSTHSMHGTSKVMGMENAGLPTAASRRRERHEKKIRRKGWNAVCWGTSVDLVPRVRKARRPV